MSPVAARCPGCGATIEFRNAATLLVVCPYCGGASTRTDVDWKLLGKVAAVADIESVLAKGARGRMGSRRWEAVGRIQLDHGLGPWNEWCLAFEDGGWAWLAEAQGQLLLTERAVDVKAPKLAGLKPEQTVPMGARGVFLVAEVGRAKVTTIEGELPVRRVPGAPVRYADLRGPQRGFATLDFGAGEAAASVYVGRVVSEAELGIDASTVEKKEPRLVGARRLACPKCAATVVVKASESVRATCPSCGSLLDLLTEPLVVIGTGAALAKRPTIPLGARGKLRGIDVEVRAYLVRSVRVAGVRYPWEEYLLAARGEAGKDLGWRWLVASAGHWSLVEPADLGDMDVTYRSARYRGLGFDHFQGGKATVDHVQGEVYWQVAVGETVRVDDYVAPPRMLSFERSPTETVVSQGSYVPKGEIEAAFALAAPLKLPDGVGAAQENPWAGRASRWWLTYGALAAALVLLMIVFHARSDRRVVLDRMFTLDLKAPPAPTGLPPAVPAVPGAPASPAPDEPTPPEAGVVFTDEFELSASSANLRVEFTEGHENTWAGLDGALVNLGTGEVHAFEVDAERWSGVEGGESWSEGSGKGTVYLGRVPAGRYAMRLDPVASPEPPQMTFRVRATSQVASVLRPLLLLLVLALVPLFVTIASRNFERKRWAESDHPGGPAGGATASGGGGSGGDEDDDGDEEDDE